MTAVTDPVGSTGDMTQPVQVYILAGQSNMVGMGEIEGGGQRWGSEFVDPVLSVYPGDYDPKADYDKMTPSKTMKLDEFGGIHPTAYPGGGTQVVRGFIEPKQTGLYEMRPGYGSSEFNIMEIDGKGVYRRLPDQPSQKTPIELTKGKKVPFKITYLTQDANGLGWMMRLDVPGTLTTVVKQQHEFPYLLDEKGNWAVRHDVDFYEARISFTGGPLTIPVRAGKNTIGPEVGFGHMVGQADKPQVLLIKTAMGNRALAWDFRPPSSGALPNVAEKDKKWEGLEWKLMVEGVHKTLDNIDKVVPGYKGQGYKIVGLFWWQGEKDSHVKEWRESYEQNMVNFINDVRKTFGVPKLPVVIASIGFGGMQEMNDDYKVVWQAQMNVGDAKLHPEFAGNVTTVDTRSFWRSVDQSPRGQGYHYNRNAETYMLVGEACGKAMVEMQDK